MPSPLEEIKNFRLQKLANLKNLGVDPYPPSLGFRITEIAGLKKDFKKLAAARKKIGVAGRIVAQRGHGGLVFIDVFDGKGKLQILLAKDKTGENAYKIFSENIDVGDFVAFWGVPFYTKKKESTIEASRWQILAKSLLPLPEKWHGLQDVEERFRKRYLDILMNPEVFQRFGLRSALIANLRSILSEEGYIEVETPILQPLYGGALAEPFITHHRMLDTKMYLRVAPELYLKRLLVAGFSKIYEIGKNFRNEGLDATHNPEFTTIELYTAYKDAAYLREFIAAVLTKLIQKTLKKTLFVFEGQNIKFTKKIPAISFWSVIERYAMLPGAANLIRDDLALRAKQLGIDIEKSDTKDKIADKIFKKVCKPKMIQPVYVIDYPIGFSPLAKSISKNNQLVDRFQLVVGGIEIINAFSELNDPEEQKNRFVYQEKLRDAGEKEAQPMDAEFIEALEYGMPPAAGLAVSIDRLTMLLSNTHNIKEVIIFPTMKPKV